MRLLSPNATTKDAYACILSGAGMRSRGQRQSGFRSRQLAEESCLADIAGNSIVSFQIQSDIPRLWRKLL